jgi:class 3 adenylate cyclase
MSHLARANPLTALTWVLAGVAVLSLGLFILTGYLAYRNRMERRKFLNTLGEPVPWKPNVRSLGSSAVPSTPPAPERQMVSVLRADLVGLSDLYQKRTAEQIRELTSVYAATARNIVQRRGGTVEKVLDDALLAVWAAPMTRGDAAQSAMLAAFALVASAEELGQSIEAPEFRTRAGVVSSEVAIPFGSEGESLATDALVNMASRVESVAGPGLVFVDEPTRRLTENGIDYANAGSIELEGQSEPMTLWAGVGVTKEAVAQAEKEESVQEALNERARFLTIGDLVMDQGLRKHYLMLSRLESQAPDRSSTADLPKRSTIGADPEEATRSERHEGET